MNTIDVMKQTLEFIRRVTHWDEGDTDKHDVITNLRAAITNAEKDDPVEWELCKEDLNDYYTWNQAPAAPEKL